MSKKIINFTALIFCLFTISACKKTSFEREDGVLQPSPSATPKVIVDPLPSNISKSTVCTQDGKTAAELKTPTVKNGAANQSLTYEIQLLNCDDTKKDWLKAGVMFDLNGRIFNLTQVQSTIQYSIKVIKPTNITKTYAGKMVLIKGADLFGNVADNYYFLRTSDLLDYPKEVEVIEFKLSMSGVIVGSNEDGPTASAPISNFSSLDTFLRIGNSQPIQKAVQFDNSGVIR